MHSQCRGPEQTAPLHLCLQSLPCATVAGPGLLDSARPAYVTFILCICEPYASLSTAKQGVCEQVTQQVYTGFCCCKTTIPSLPPPWRTYTPAHAWCKCVTRICGQAGRLGMVCPTSDEVEVHTWRSAVSGCPIAWIPVVAVIISIPGRGPVLRVLSCRIGCFWSIARRPICWGSCCCVMVCNFRAWNLWLILINTRRGRVRHLSTTTKNPSLPVQTVSGHTYANSISYVMEAVHIMLIAPQVALAAHATASDMPVTCIYPEGSTLRQPFVYILP